MPGQPKRRPESVNYTFHCRVGEKEYCFDDMTEAQKEAARTAAALRMENARLLGSGRRAYAENMPDLDALFPGK